MRTIASISRLSRLAANSAGHIQLGERCSKLASRTCDEFAQLSSAFAFRELPPPTLRLLVARLVAVEYPSVASEQRAGDLSSGKRLSPRWHDADYCSDRRCNQSSAVHLEHLFALAIVASETPWDRAASSAALSEANTARAALALMQNHVSGFSGRYPA